MKCNIICKFATRENSDMELVETRNIRLLDDLISNAKKVTVAAHIHPDGDAIGSTQALREYLERRGVDTVTVYTEAVPETLAFAVKGVPEDRILAFDTQRDAAIQRIAESDLLFCLDCNGPSRIGDIGPCYRESTARKVLIDHHIGPESEIFDLVFSETKISSASELLYNILLAMPDICGDAGRLPKYSAESLMLGMTTDTNNFANSVYPSTLAMASGLLSAGVDRDAILACLYNNYRENRLRLEGHLLHDNMKITPEGVAYMIVDRGLMQKYDIREGETEGFVNMPLAIDRVGMSIFLKQDSDGFFRISIRSKKGVSANRCATKYFHGGGHENASGGRLFFAEGYGCEPDIASPADAESYVLRIVRELYESGEYESR